MRQRRDVPKEERSNAKAPSQRRSSWAPEPGSDAQDGTGEGPGGGSLGAFHSQREGLFS